MDMKALRAISITNILLKRWILPFKKPSLFRLTIARKGIHINKKSIMKQEIIARQGIHFRRSRFIRPTDQADKRSIFLTKNHINNLSLSPISLSFYLNLLPSV